MEFSILPAVITGLVGTLAMTLVVMMARSGGMTEMPPMPLVLGTMMTGDRGTAKLIGAMLHFVLMGAIVFGLIYAALFVAFDSAIWWVGIIIGAVHGLLVGALGLPMMDKVHPRMVPATPEGSAISGTPEETTIEAPGFFGIAWGRMTGAGLVLAHAVYGLVVALAYSALV